MDKNDLKDKWWYRLLQVLFGVSVIFFVAFFSYVSYLQKPDQVIDPNRSQVHCESNDKSASYAQVNDEILSVDIRSDKYVYVDDYEEIETARKADQLSQSQIMGIDVIFCDQSGGLIEESSDSLSPKAIREAREPNFTLEPHLVYTSSIGGYILNKIGWLLLLLLSFGTIRQLFIYVVTGQSLLREDGLINRKTLSLVALSGIYALLSSSLILSGHWSDWLVAIGGYILLLSLGFYFFISEAIEPDDEYDNLSESGENKRVGGGTGEIAGKEKNVNEAKNEQAFSFGDWAALLVSFFLMVGALIALPGDVIGSLLAVLYGNLEQALYPLASSAFMAVTLWLMHWKFNSKMEKYKRLRSDKKYNVLWWVLVMLVALPILSYFGSIIVAAITAV